MEFHVPVSFSPLQDGYTILNMKSNSIGVESYSLFYTYEYIFIVSSLSRNGHLDPRPKG
jgi:hypothetical protein